MEIKVVIMVETVLNEFISTISVFYQFVDVRQCPFFCALHCANSTWIVAKPFILRK
ncbi:MAG: hypothetical protein ACO1NU_05380 [Arcticibacter sp.]